MTFPKPLIVIFATVVACAFPLAAEQAESAPLKFADDLLAEVHRSVDGPEGAVELRMDFSDSREVEYEFEQKQETRSSFGTEATDEMTNQTTSLGALVVKSSGDGTAKLVVRDVEMTMVFEGDASGERETMSQKLPTSVISGLTERGRFSSVAAGADPMMRMLFPLPVKLMSPGESFEIPIEIPFNAMGSPLMVRGTSTIAFTGYVDLAGHLGARLDVTTEVRDLDVPEEIEGEYAMELSSKGVYFFDLESRVFDSGAIAVSTTMRIRVPAASMPQLGEDEASDMEMSMDLDALIRYARK